MKQSITLILILFLSLNNNALGQAKLHKSHFPIWTFHQDSIDINGLSVGILTYNDKPMLTNTNGIKFELIGMGIIFPLIPRSPIVENDSSFVKLKLEPLSERINGFNLSTTGTSCHCLTNGVNAGLIGQINYQVNGISVSVVGILNQKHNGIMASWFNEAYYINGLQVGLTNLGQKAKGLQIGILNNKSKDLKGVQISLFNKADKLRGIQVGLWNVNDKRKLPFINWNFK